MLAVRVGGEAKQCGDLLCLLYDTGSVKFGCPLWKGVEERSEWPQVTIVMADSQLRSCCLLFEVVDFEMSSLNSLKF